jgi:hypothetical protein
MNEASRVDPREDPMVVVRLLGVRERERGRERERREEKRKEKREIEYSD